MKNWADIVVELHQDAGKFRMLGNDEMADSLLSEINKIYAILPTNDLVSTIQEVTSRL